MEMKKKIIIGLAVLLIAIGCGKKEEKNADKNNSEKTAAETSKDSGNISENEIKKYTEYISLKNVPSEEEWQDSFKEVFTREFSDEKGEFKKPSAKGIESIIKTEDTVNIFSEYVKDLEENIKKEKYSLESYNKIRGYSKEVVTLSEKIMESKRNGEDIYPLLYDFSENYRKIVSEYNKMIGNKK